MHAHTQVLPVYGIVTLSDVLAALLQYRRNTAPPAHTGQLT
jgi:hypothetical protein